MSINIKGYPSGNVADVDSNHAMLVNLSKALSEAGYSISSGEPHDGATGAPRLIRAVDLSPDFRTRVGVDSLLWHDVFNHTQLNLSKYLGAETTMTKALAGGRLSFNNGNSLAAGAVARVQTFRTFTLYLSYALYIEFELMFTQAPVANNFCEFGLGFATATTTPTDGVFFRLTASGQLIGVINNGGAEVSTVLDFIPIAAEANHYLIVVNNDKTEFWINDTLYGAIETPPTNGSPSLAMSLPILMRECNSAATAVAQRMEVLSLGVSLADVATNRLWATCMSGMGLSSVNQPDSVAAAQSANYANSAAPASATLSNTAAGYTTLGGQFQFAAVGGAETDFALFAYQVPVGCGRNLLIRGVRIDCFNMGAAVATTATLLQWSLGVGSTAVSLATADNGATGLRGPRRVPLGVQALPVASAIGAVASPIDINLDAPILVEAGTYIHVILKIPVGTATASQIIRGTVMINGIYE